jgi:hypothetical protein
MRLDDIPSAAQPAAGAPTSSVVARIRAVRPSRRAVLRTLVLGAAAAALVPLDWYLTRRSAAAAPREAGENLTEYTTCAPGSYDEDANNWPARGRAVCYGGWRRGGFPCADGWHREGRYADGEDTAESTRLATSCEGRNAWRWNGHRCSDAMTTVTFADGTEYSGVTIASCALDPSDLPAEGPADAYAEPDDEDGAGEGGDGGEDEREPERASSGLLPALSR